MVRYYLPTGEWLPIPCRDLHYTSQQKLEEMQHSQDTGESDSGEHRLTEGLLCILRIPRLWMKPKVPIQFQLGEMEMTLRYWLSISLQYWCCNITCKIR